MCEQGSGALADSASFDGLFGAPANAKKTTLVKNLE
jgi:hypothetical protein